MNIDDSLMKAWGNSEVRPEIVSTFYLGVAEGAILAQKHSPDEIVNHSETKIRQAHAALSKMPWWRRIFIRA